MTTVTSRSFSLRKMLTKAAPLTNPITAAPQELPAATQLQHYQVQYALPAPQPGSGDAVQAAPLPLNALIGKRLQLYWDGGIHCIHCGREISKSFHQGYCYPCFRKLARADQCALHPERCHYHAGSCREPLWGEANCLITHTVYFAISSKLKVGVTRTRHQLTRWMDQGASTAMVLAKHQERLHAGEVEVTLKAHFNDKTAWQQMLKYILTPMSQPDILSHALQEFQHARRRAQTVLDPAAPNLAPQVVSVFYYPLTSVPPMLKQLYLEKTATLSGVLLGIKGQYLILDTGVFNVRKFGGYAVTLSVQ